MPAVLFVFALLLALAGCADEAGRDAETEFGKRLIADLQAGNFKAIEAHVDPAAAGDKARAALARMAKVLPADTPTSIEVARLGISTVSPPGKAPERRVSLALQYRFGDRWFLVRARWRRPEAGAVRIASLNVGPLPASLQQINRFELAGKSRVHYTVLGWAIVLPVFTLFALWLCLRAPIPRWRKALWAVLIAFGVTTLSLNWTSGTMIWQPLSVQLGSASFAKTELGPAFVSISIPLGAVVFLFWRGMVFLFRGRRQRRPPRSRSRVSAHRAHEAAG